MRCNHTSEQFLRCRAWVHARGEFWLGCSPSSLGGCCRGLQAINVGLGILTIFSCLFHENTQGADSSADITAPVQRQVRAPLNEAHAEPRCLKIGKSMQQRSLSNRTDQDTPTMSG